MKTFLIITELGRIIGRISFYIAELTPQLRLIDNDFTCSMSSNRGILNEAVSVLKEKNEIDKKDFTDGVLKRDKRYNFIVVEGRGLNYINELNF